MIGIYRSGVSVIICSYTEDRWDDLMAVVKSVQQQEPSPSEIIVVVDHNPNLLERVRSSMLDVIVVDNTEARGASGARNSGLAIAAGNKIAFLDDDAVAEPGWLTRLSRWCDEPGVLGAGGKTEPIWLAGRPRWFPDEFGWVVGSSYTGMPEAAAPIRNLFSGNLCVRRDVLESIGGFRCEFGKVGKRSEPEDTEICIRALQRWPDCVWMYEPAARILHKVPASRSRWRFFVGRCFNEGLGKAALVHLVGVKDGLSAERTYTRQTLVGAIGRGVIDAVQHRDLAKLMRVGAIVIGLALTTAGYLAGRISNMRKATRNASSVSAQSQVVRTLKM